MSRVLLLCKGPHLAEPLIGHRMCCCDACLVSFSQLSREMLDSLRLPPSAGYSICPKLPTTTLSLFTRSFDEIAIPCRSDPASFIVDLASRHLGRLRQSRKQMMLVVSAASSAECQSYVAN